MFSKIFRILNRIDPIMLVLMGVLISTGMMFIYGSVSQLGGSFAGLWKKQLFWIICGTIAFLITSAVDYRVLARFSSLFYIAVNGVLISLFFIGKTVNQAKSWLEIGPFTLQPSELAKPAVILFLAWLGSVMPRGFKTLRWICAYGAACLLPVMLVAAQPDWGTALVFIPIGAAIAFAGGLPWKYVIVSVLLAVILLPLAYTYVLKDRQQRRILTFLNPEEDTMGAGYNAHQSLLAVGSGGIMGKGFTCGHQYKLGYLPRNVAPTDFIFSVIGEETGFIGGLMLIFALLGLIVCCLRTGSMACDSLGAMICAGTVAFLFIHSYVNIGMTIGAAPIIGIPLPLVSYGGSFTIATMACLGLVQSVYARRNEKRKL